LSKIDFDRFSRPGRMKETGFLYPMVEINSFVSKLDQQSILEDIDQGTYDQDFDIGTIDPTKDYTFTKSHFLGNVAIDYEYYCEELDNWFYEGHLKSRPRAL